MESQTIYLRKIDNKQDKLQIERTLSQIIGVNHVSVEIEKGQVFIEFETPASLNNLEKDLYDLGFEILY
ncbi:putative copper chaperone CsoZ [Staphylococcus ureilyticus]|uniref:putative copper chaperone CsoZ n=1 Tax=Staphylococcus ureilyticus TaxID=94138 RepID=UPI0021D10A0D|nr:heavy metal-associated domain-containing protein [Staphylococcus ureilyticus]UXS59192.1 heavy-metal-associated domain-containing protein [Staphylococcus ureilyticus]